MNTPPDILGQTRAPTRSPHGSDPLAPICDVNEQCLQMLVEMASTSGSTTEPFVHQLLALVETLDAATLATATRFPFLLVDFGFRDPDWWHAIAKGDDKASGDVACVAALPRTMATTLARSTVMLAWHTVRTDAETAVVLLGITPEVARVLKALRLPDIDRIAERHYQRIRPRWEDRPGVWRQLLLCAKSTQVEAAHDFVLHALQLTAGAALPKADGIGPAAPRSHIVLPRLPRPARASLER